MLLLQKVVAGASQADSLISTSCPRIIDIASGAGEPGITLAKKFPSGSILITDIAPGMISEAKRQCADAGVHNTRCGLLGAL
jgi:ubiquinone/menaquinone biosynthesis C-methylase UbiE